MTASKVTQTSTQLNTQSNIQRTQLFSQILGTGSYLPEDIVTNYDLEKRVDTTHEWIVTRTGIESRHIAKAHETTTFMATEAAKKALEAAQIKPESIDLVIVATCTSDRVFPSTACLVQDALGIPSCPAFDVQAACSGFIYGLSVVDQFVRSGIAKRPLLIGAEMMSRMIDWNDRKTCVLFGDGAGAVVFGAGKTPGILSTNISADGRFKDILFKDNKPEASLQMQGNTVFKLAVNMLDKIAMEALSANGLTLADIDWVVPHQANIRIIQALAEKLDIPLSKVIITVQKHGNTSSASIPLALDYAIRENKIKRKERLLFDAFGGGLTWGTAVLEY